MGRAMGTGPLGRERAPSIPPEVVWAALDCPSGLAAAEAACLGQDTIILLGQMTVTGRVAPGRRPVPGDRLARRA